MAEVKLIFEVVEVVVLQMSEQRRPAAPAAAPARPDRPLPSTAAGTGAARHGTLCTAVVRHFLSPTDRRRLSVNKSATISK